MTKARDLANIISGGFTESDIPNLSASKITSGTLDNARITLDANEIPNISTDKLTSGTIPDARLPSTALNSNVDLTTLSASNLSSGTIPNARYGTPTFNGSNLTNLPGGGKVLQVVAVNKTDVFVTNSSSFTSVTGLNSGNITPASTSSKFLVTIHLGSFSNSGDNSRAFGRIVRNVSGGADTTLHVGDASNGHEVGFALCLRGTSGTHSQTPVAFQYLDSPNTTTAVNYRLDVTVGSDGGNIAINTAYSSTAERGNTASSITVQEISS